MLDRGDAHAIALGPARSLAILARGAVRVAERRRDAGADGDAGADPGSEPVRRRGGAHRPAACG